MIVIVSLVSLLAGICLGIYLTTQVLSRSQVLDTLKREHRDYVAYARTESYYEGFGDGKKHHQYEEFDKRLTQSGFVDRTRFKN